MVAPTPHTYMATCKHCQKQTEVSIIEGPLGAKPSRYDCPHCRHLLPLPPVTAMEAYLRDQHPSKKH